VTTFRARRLRQQWAQKGTKLKLRIVLGIAVLLTAGCGGSAATDPGISNPVATTSEATTAPDSGETPSSTVTTTMAQVAEPLRSSAGEAEALLTVVNAWDGPVSIFWVDYEGVEIPFGSVSVGASLEVGTFEGHAWRILDEISGHVLEEFNVEDSDFTVELVSPELDPALHPANACKLRNYTSDAGSHLGFPRPAHRLPATGLVKGTVLFVDFSDAPASRSPEETFALISPEAEQAFTTMSYGHMNLVWQPHFEWFRAELPSTDYDWPNDVERWLAYIQDAADQASSVVDLSETDFLLVVANPDADAIWVGPALATGPDWGGISVDGVDGDPRMIFNGATSGADLLGWGALWLNHEAGHALGLLDLYDLSYVDLFGFTGDFSLMGNIGGRAPGLFAYERWLLGWVDDDQVSCTSERGATVTLQAVETSGGTKMAVVKTGPTTLVVVESRRRLGYDEYLVETGAVVYTVDTSVETGQGPIIVHRQAGEDFDQAPLGVGESLVVDGVMVTVVAADEHGDTIEIVIDGNRP